MSDLPLEQNALHDVLAFAWRNRDRATENDREQILIALATHGKLEERGLATQVLSLMRAQRKYQFELDGILRQIGEGKDGQS